jgi:L-lysine 2,3-aminomutase
MHCRLRSELRLSTAAGVEPIKAHFAALDEIQIEIIIPNLDDIPSVLRGRLHGRVPTGPARITPAPLWLRRMQ